MPVWIEWNLIQCLVDIGSWMNIHLTFGWPQVGMDYFSLSHSFPSHLGTSLYPQHYCLGTRWWDPPWGRNASGNVSFHSTPVQFYTNATAVERARGRWDWHTSHIEYSLEFNALHLSLSHLSLSRNRICGHNYIMCDIELLPDWLEYGAKSSEKDERRLGPTIMWVIWQLDNDVWWMVMVYSTCIWNLSHNGWRIEYEIMKKASDGSSQQPKQWHDT